MERGAQRDNEFFNCSQKHEVAHVASQYEDPAKVTEFIRKHCAAGIIHYWTHKKVYEHLKKNGFVKRAN